MINSPIDLRVVFYLDEDGDWIAHCLECDLYGHGATQAEAATMLRQAIAIQFEQASADRCRDNFYTVAAPEFFDLFATGQNVATWRWPEVANLP